RRWVNASQLGDVVNGRGGVFALAL
ncbi:MAG: hypothetical protein RIQ37_874, partial [Actinomycetota bacterium]